MKLVERSLLELRELLAGGEVSPLEVTRSYLESIEERNATYGAFLSVFSETAEERAKSLESEDLARLPLGGIPVAVKDNICTADRPTTCASRILEGYRPPYSATVVERLERSGAVILGKTNMDEFAMGSSTEFSRAGPSRNPWDLSRSPGGSSGGSAVAVAAGMVPAALGSDTGGSIRQPAAMTGIVGMKPTYGRISRYGLVAFASSLDQIGPFTRNVADMAFVLEHLCGHDPRDSTSSNRTVENFGAGLNGELEGLTLGLPVALYEDLGGEARRSFETALQSAKEAGASVREIELPHATYSIACYYVVANAEASSNLARFDGVRFGRRGTSAEDVLSLYRSTREEGFGDEVKRRILLGTFVLSAGYYDAYYSKAQKVRTLILRDFERAFGRCDLIALPTSPTSAFRIGERVGDPLQMYLSDIFTTPASLAGLPGISIPSGLDEKGLPLGIQLMAPAFEEARLLQGAYGLEKAIGFDESPLSSDGGNEGRKDPDEL